MSESNTTQAQWNACVKFHGHECPGLAIGFKAAQAGLEWGKGLRSEDEEIVAVVENNACGVDAVQVLTGCTFGKGNLIHLDYGKQVFTFYNRDKSRGVRLSLRDDAMPVSDRYEQLMQQIRSGNAGPEAMEERNKLRKEMMRAILAKTTDEMFKASEPLATVPDKAVVQESENCAVCGEPTMPLKMVEVKGRHLCRPCADKEL